MNKIDQDQQSELCCVLSQIVFVFTCMRERGKCVIVLCGSTCVVLSQLFLWTYV